jgi:hypothetical protein
MKIIAIALGLAAGFTAQLCAGETLRLKFEQNQYGSGTRKSLQNESWQWRNSKN